MRNVYCCRRIKLLGMQMVLIPAKPEIKTLSSLNSDVDMPRAMSFAAHRKAWYSVRVQKTIKAG
jgi:hypothetical protein